MGSEQPTEKTRHPKRSTGKVDAHLTKKLESVEWAEFSLGELFNVERGTRLTKENRKKGEIPLVTAGEQNLGVKEFISNSNQKIFEKAITIDMFCNSFVHIHRFCCDDNILVLTPKNEISLKSYYFISSMISKEKEKFGYGKQYRLNSFDNHKISLPVKISKKNPATQEIDFDFMDRYIAELEAQRIAELEAQRIAELEAYLLTTGLSNYKLTKQEEEAIMLFNQSEIGGVNH